MKQQDKTLVTDTHVYFLNGPFSQWHPSVFTVTCNMTHRDRPVVNETMTFNCAEQFMMACKAMMFGDRDILDKIMASSSPREQKALGRQVIGFDANEWNKNAKSLVYIGNYSKFTQNPDLKDYLLSSEDRYLVEGAHYDQIWGVGLAWNDPAILDRNNWQGTNWLGEVLMQVRNCIRLEE